MPDRPPLHHNVTSPDLLCQKEAYSPHPAPQPLPPGKKEGKELLEALRDRLNEVYRDIVFPVPLRDNPKYQQRVSFDTIDIQYAEPDDERYPARDDFLGDLLPRGRGRERDSGRSPSTSPNRMLSPMRGRDMNALFVRGGVPYPTTPIITRRGCNVLRLHRDFEKLYLGRLAHRGLHPVLPRRVILVYISGRRHTWVALDWVLRTFIEHGDSVVVVAALSHRLGRAQGRYSNYQLPQRYQPQTPRVRFRQRTRPEFIKTLAADVMEYCLRVVNPAVIAKITVEISEGKTKDVLKDMYRLYEPNIVATGSKTNARNSAPLKLWNSLRLSDRLVKNFPLPVLVVPALNMAPFEQRLCRAVVREAKGRGARGAVPDEPSSLDPEPVPAPDLAAATTSGDSAAATNGDSDSDSASLSDVSLHSELSTGSLSSTESYSSYEEIADLYEDYKHNVRTQLRQLSGATVDPHYFANFAKAISDTSLQFCEDLSGVNPNFKGQGAVLARAITGSNSFGAVPYKTKSLLAPVEPLLKKPPAGALSYEELKRNLKHGAGKPPGGPHIAVQLPSPVLSPTSGSPLQTPKLLTLTFVESEKPSSRKLRVPLKKFLSNDESALRRVDLEPSKSHPNIRGMETVVPDASKKKKKKRFFKLF